MSRASVLVYPHSMELGGSQLNAIELAAAAQETGFRVAVYARDGALVDYVKELGLDYVPAAPSRITPGPAIARDLERVSRARDIDVIHGYEWPPILEGFASSLMSRRGVAVVGTVMSMAVAPFIPSSIALAVGTSRLQAHTAARRTGRVHLIEPPVDVRANRPGVSDPVARARIRGDAAEPLVVLVSRLVPELKLEGVLTAVRAVGDLARSRPLRLVVVGGGSAAPQVEALARQTNLAVGREVILLTGPMSDPRPAYDEADVCIGMGGSALRAMAFAKPLVVQGEGGFFETLSPTTLDDFLDQGWYGRSSRTQDEAVLHLRCLLTGLLDSAGQREALGRFARQVVEQRFSVEVMAARQADIYEAAAARMPRRRTRLMDAAGSGQRFAWYWSGRRWQRVRGTKAVDDFNARPT